MFKTTHRAAAALCAAVGTFALGATVTTAAPDSRPAAGRANAAFVSPPPAVARQFHWYRWHPSKRVLSACALAARVRTFGSTAVIGLESNADLRRLRKTYGFGRVVSIPQLHAVQVTVDRPQLDALLARAPSDKRIRYVSPVPRRHLLHMRNDPLLRNVDPTTGAPYEWQFFASRVDLAMNLSHGSPNVLACTIDSGVADVPDLAGKVVSWWYFVGQTPTEATGGTDVEGHGTVVASLIAANVDDGFGMAGFGGAVRIISFRDDDLSDTSSAIAMTKLVSLGCRIINMSFGGPDPVSGILKDAIDRAFAHDVLLVGSAGNDGADQPVLYPAADLQPDGGAPSMGLAVGSSNFAGEPSSFSNAGSRLSLLAPGDYDNGCSHGVLGVLPPVSNIWDNTVCPTIWNGPGGARYAYVNGTSFSAPEVAGVAALIWAVRPDLENWQVAEIIKRSARHDGPEAWTPERGFGVLDAAAALELATGRSSADELKIASFVSRRVGNRVTATGQAVWSDGDPADDATVACSAVAGGRKLTAKVATIAAGRFTCSWNVPTAHAHGTLHGAVTVDDPQIDDPASQTFTQGQPRVP